MATLPGLRASITVAVSILAIGLPRASRAVEIDATGLLHNEELLLRAKDGTVLEARYVETRGDTLVLRRGPEVLGTTPAKLDRIWVRRKNAWSGLAAGSGIGLIGGGLPRIAGGGDCPGCGASRSDVVSAAVLEAMVEGTFGMLAGAIGGHWAPFAPNAAAQAPRDRNPFPAWGISARGGATWTLNDSPRDHALEDPEKAGHVGGRVSGWKNVSFGQAWCSIGRSMTRKCRSGPR